MVPEKRVKAMGQIARPKYFFGQFIHAVDAKGRISIPAAFCERGEGGRRDIVILKDPHHERLIGYYADESPLEFRATQLSAAFSRAAHMDPENRIALTREEQAKLKISTDIRDLVIVGRYTYFEIWNQHDWAPEQQSRAAELRHSLPVARIDS